MKMANVPPWPENELEYLGHCPVCGSPQRKKLLEALYDRFFNAPGYWTLYYCEECKSGYLDPRPTPEAIGKAYARYSTHDVDNPPNCPQTYLRRLRMSTRNGYLNRRYGYKAEPAVPWGCAVMFLLPPPLRLEWDWYARHLPRPEPGRNRLLDVGCGNGEFLLRAQQAGWEVEGLDFDPKAVALARQRGLRVWCAEYRQAPFSEATFDAITSSQVIEHVHNPSDFVARLSSWLKPGGTIWINTPNFSSLGRRVFDKDWKPLHPPQHLVLLSFEALCQLYKNNGLRARVHRRGFHETHVLAQSLALRHGAQTYEEILALKRKFKRPILGAAFETVAWLWPRMVSDIVVIGHKES